MVPVSASLSSQRSERRISVRLPMHIRGRDSRGVIFEEETSSENLCRSGAAFLTRFDVAVGSDLQISIPFSYYAPRRNAPERPSAAATYGPSAAVDENHGAAFARKDSDFATQGRVVHVADAKLQGEKLVGVQFTGPRFQRVFRSESAA